jgi:hypothetical protein
MESSRTERVAVEKRARWLFDQLGGLVNAEADYVAAGPGALAFPTVELRLDPDEGLTAADLADRLAQADPPVQSEVGPDQWTIQLDVRDVDDRGVQRVADAVLAILMPGSVGF